MSEIKRVALNTLEPQKVSDKVTKKQCKTIRISVILPESNEDNCPEYNYKDQLAAVKKKPKQVKDYNHVENGLDSFGETDDDVRRIALKMEAKYGTGMTDGKKKRKGRKDDYADIGMGYDESDSFIDNTDGYDEIIPQNVTTLHGGFYINCGALEFKTDEEASSQLSSSSSSFSDNEGGDQSKTNRKRILDTSSDSETATSQVEKKPKLLTPKDSMQQAIKKKLFSPNKIQVKKRRPIDPLKKTLKDLLREKREDLNMTIPSELKQIEENMEKDSSKENKVPMSITSVTDAIESVLKQVVEEDDYDKNQNMQSVDIKKAELSINKNVVESLKSQHVEAESSQELSKSEKQEVTKLPENLPPDIIVIVDKIRNAAVNYKGEGKKAFFTDEVNSYLLSLEKKCKVLGKSSRLRVYEHLSGFVVCRKETLIKRAKNLVFEDEEKRLKMLTAKLRDTINSVMPNLLSNYEQESQKVLQKKFSKENTNNEDMKALKMPRRKFQWTEDAKKLIKDILSIKKRCLLLEGKQKDKLEEQVVDYLRSSILPLWPEGWMYLNNLKKVYNSKSETKQPEENIMFKPYIDKNSKSGSQHTKSIPPDVDQPSDLSKNSTYDMFKAYVPDVGKQSEYSKSTGQSDVFKPYTDKILHVDKKETILSNADRTSPQAEQVPSQNISTYAENYVSHMEKYYPNKPISLDSSVENPVVHSENRGNPSRHTENNIEEIMITIPEKKIHKTENPKEKPIEKPNVVDKSQDKI
ncbi:hypothetical protein JTB14_006030 [Gonioctena quinquepunctata]|nr:hypothetical protein JTB14_006030 [Gonioctena quinquepunctata]